MMYKVTFMKDMEPEWYGLFHTLMEATQAAEAHAPEDATIVISPQKLEYHITAENARGGKILDDVVNDNQVEDAMLEALWLCGYSSGSVIKVEML